MIKFSRLLLGDEALIGRITFRHAPHAQAAQVERHFEVPVEWGAELDALWFQRHLLDMPLRGAFPTLHAQAAERLARKVAERGDPLTPTASPALVSRIEQAFADKPRLLGLGLDAELPTPLGGQLPWAFGDVLLGRVASIVLFVICDC